MPVRDIDSLSMSTGGWPGTLEGGSRLGHGCGDAWKDSSGISKDVPIYALRHQNLIIPRITAGRIRSTISEQSSYRTPL